MMRSIKTDTFRSINIFLVVYLQLSGINPN